MFSKRLIDLKMSTTNSGFLFKKWTVIILCSFVLIAKIIVTSLILMNFTKYIRQKAKQEQIKYMSKEYENKLKKETILTVIIPDIVTILFILIGLIGAIREHFYLSLAFCLLFLLSVIRSIIDFINDPAHWWEFILILLLMIIDILFVYDLYRNQQSSSSKSIAKTIRSSGNYDKINFIMGKLDNKITVASSNNNDNSSSTKKSSKKSSKEKDNYSGVTSAAATVRSNQ